MAKNKPAAAPKPADNTIYKAMIDMAILAFCIILLQIVDRGYNTYDIKPWQDGLMTFSLVAVGVVVALAAAAVFTKGNWRKLCIGAAVFTALLSFGSYVLAKTWLIYMPYYYFIVIASTCLYLVWLLYPHDFFLISTLATLCGGAFYRHGQSLTKALSMMTVAIYAALVVLIIATIVLAQLAGKKKGLLTIGRKTLRLFSGKAGATPLYLTCAILLACILASVILGGGFAFYCVYAAVGGLFVAACYYTIRLN